MKHHLNVTKIGEFNTNTPLFKEKNGARFKKIPIFFINIHLLIENLSKNYTLKNFFQNFIFFKKIFTKIRFLRKIS